MSVTDEDVSIVKRFIDECVLEPKFTHEDDIFKIQCFTSWAAGEILDLVVEELMKPPVCVTGKTSKDLVDILEEYAFTMDLYHEWCSEGKDDSIDVFSVAASTADDLLYFYVYERGKINE